MKANEQTETVTLSLEEQTSAILASSDVKSVLVRKLSLILTKEENGSRIPDRSAILKVMKIKYPNMIYQHVRNILITPIKKS